ncbi:class III poly(R)-hydroxyalkanoic acid synthase subunit PhaC [Brevibacillus ginsengisoli]|uniref:class III poly(R)-hydroxyalkanoic acid synthase subunit PhaC n=1 Tax=Brevibacillus ginsengisoli TaxID=363854 RepID=UPI003CF24D02
MTVPNYIESWNEMVKHLPEPYQKSIARMENVREALTGPEPEVGLTPKECIWTKNKAKLYRYIPVKPQEERHKIPLLLIYALINKPYIMDLTPGMSMVEYLVNQGFDVYLLDWGVFQLEDKDITFDDLVFDYIPRAVDKVLRTSSANELSVLGYCMGGTITSMFVATHPHLPIRNQIQLASPIDFEDAGTFTVWLDERYYNLNKMVDTFGIIPPEILDFGNKLLKPITNFVGPWVNLIDRGADEKFIKNWRLLNKWVADGTPFPGAAFKQWIRDFYQQNKLIKGELVLRGHRVDLSQIKANLLTVVAERDHIALPCQSIALNNVVSSEDKSVLELPTGHVSIVNSGVALKQFFPALNEWLSARSN